MTFDPEIGQIYARRRSGKAAVVRVVARTDEWVEYQFLHGPARDLRAGVGRCKARNFAAAGWQPTPECADYNHLDGATKFDTFRVLDTTGNPILRCSAKRAAFYLRKGFAREVEPGVLQFTDPQTEERLKVLYSGGGFTEFFMEVKNDRCCACGATADLTRHHVVPKRHKKNVPQPWRSCLSNVLFVCGSCHRKYEESPEPSPPAGDWQEYVRAWKAHFFAVLQPRFVPPGWDIVSVRNLDAVE